MNAAHGRLYSQYSPGSGSVYSISFKNGAYITKHATANMIAMVTYSCGFENKPCFHMELILVLAMSAWLNWVSTMLMKLAAIPS